LIDSFGSRDDQVGEAGPVEQKLTEAKSLKTKAKGLSDYRSSETVVETTRQGASGPNKRATLPTYLLKNGELKRSSLLDRKRAKSSPPEKKQHG
jgi:hypothetical protein